jgi:hypothetical protein
MIAGNHRFNIPNYAVFDGDVEFVREREWRFQAGKR